MSINPRPTTNSKCCSSDFLSMGDCLSLSVCEQIPTLVTRVKHHKISQIIFIVANVVLLLR